VAHPYKDSYLFFWIQSGKNPIHTISFAFRNYSTTEIFFDPESSSQFWYNAVQLSSFFQTPFLPSPYFDRGSPVFQLKSHFCPFLLFKPRPAGHPKFLCLQSLSDTGRRKTLLNRVSWFPFWSTVCFVRSFFSCLLPQFRSPKHFNMANLWPRSIHYGFPVVFLSGLLYSSFQMQIQFWCFNVSFSFSLNY